MKALNAKIAAATLAVAATFAGAAQAEECNANWINTGEVAKTLLASPVSDWNQPAIESLGAQTVTALSAQAVRLVANDVRQTERAFDQAARRQAQNKPINWEQLKATVHPVALSAVEAAEAGTPVETAKQSAIQALTDYQSEVVNTLGTLATKSAPCLVVNGGVALTPATPKP